MKPRSCKEKGKRLQKKVCKELAELAGLSFGPDKDVQSRPMSQAGPDCQLSPLAQEILGITVECKNREKWSIDAWVKEVKKNKYDNSNWVLVISKNRQREPYVVIGWNFFKELLKTKIDTGGK